MLEQALQYLLVYLPLRLTQIKIAKKMSMADSTPISPILAIFIPVCPIYTLSSGGVGRLISMGASSEDNQKKEPNTNM